MDTKTLVRVLTRSETRCPKTYRTRLRDRNLDIGGPEDLGILGIRNRTENWKTVENFYPLSEDAKARLVQRLLEPYPGAQKSAPTGVQVELFWKGVRDYKGIISAMQCMDVYQSLFVGLRGELEAFIDNAKSAGRRSLNDLKDWNYRVSDDTFAPGRNGTKTPTPEALRNNLRSTEIDIVLETPSHLFIGEAKDESRFNARSSYVLVHQLIRQYVLAKTLLTISGEQRNIVQFVVGTNVENIRKNEQVLFVEKQGWLEATNILSWDCVKAITLPSPKDTLS